MRKVTVYLPDRFVEDLSTAAISVRKAGYSLPSLSTLIGAFAYRAWLESSNGEDTEDRILVTYRREFEDVA